MYDLLVFTSTVIRIVIQTLQYVPPKQSCNCP